MIDREEIDRRMMREFKVLMDACREARVSDAHTLSEGVAIRRQMSFSPRLEETLARPWVCPHCGLRTTILSHDISLNIGGDPDSIPMCNACEKEGIAPVKGKIVVTWQ